MVSREQFIEVNRDRYGEKTLRVYTADAVLEQYLKDHTWMDDPKSHCVSCSRIVDKSGGWFSKKMCRENVQQGFSCRRETLRNHFLPFVRNALEGRYPDQEEWHEIIHRVGPYYDGTGKMEWSLSYSYAHELGETVARMTGSEEVSLEERASFCKRVQEQVMLEMDFASFSRQGVYGL
ncbi:hypothetical protein HYW46_00055 [Candidatus Daviesbacteria bacterium]|nr:hypothetical protein [Candidatus Daviesbacteria bacterium]